MKEAASLTLIRGFEMQYTIVEKTNNLAVHGVFDSLKGAEKHLDEVIPVYVDRGYYMDKTLTADNFKAIEKR